MVKEKCDLVLKTMDNSAVSRSTSQALCLLHNVETLIYAGKRHSGPSNKFKFPIAYQSSNLGKNHPVGLPTLCWSAWHQMNYPMNTVDRLRDLQLNIGQRHCLHLSLYRRSCTVCFCKDQV